MFRCTFSFSVKEKVPKKILLCQIKAGLYIVGYTGCCFLSPNPTCSHCSRAGTRRASKATPQTAEVHRTSRRGCPYRVAYYIYDILLVPAN